MTDTPSTRRWYQFHVRHLFFATTAVAAYCGVGGWLGWRFVLLGTLYLTAPASTLIHLTLTDGKRPLTSLLAGPLIQGAVFGLISVVQEIWALAIGPPLAGLGLWGFLLTPLIFFVMGAYSGIVLAALSFGFWHFVREVWPLFKAPHRN